MVDFGFGELGSAELGAPPLPPDTHALCESCNGEGVIEWMDFTGRQHPEPCTDCDGAGSIHIDDLDHADHVIGADHEYQLPKG